MLALLTLCPEGRIEVGRPSAMGPGGTARVGCGEGADPSTVSLPPTLVLGRRGIEVDDQSRVATSPEMTASVMIGLSISFIASTL